MTVVVIAVSKNPNLTVYINTSNWYNQIFNTSLSFLYTVDEESLRAAFEEMY